MHSKLTLGVFGESGFNDITIEVVHNSPNKIAKNKAYPEIGSQINPVPEPSTIALLGIGIVGLAGAAARRKLKRKR